MVWTIIAVVLTALFLIGVVLCIILEYKDYNKGVCHKCGKEWKLYDIDSQGGRMYCCHDCDTYFSISYPFIDGLF